MVRKGVQVVGVQVEKRIVQNRGASSDRLSSSECRTTTGIGY